VLGWFVAQEWLEEDVAQAMLGWPHSGFGAHVGPRIAADDRAGLLRVARYAARAPVAESRLRYDAERAEVELVSAAREGPYVGARRMSALWRATAPVLRWPSRGCATMPSGRRWSWSRTAATAPTPGCTG